MHRLTVIQLPQRNTFKNSNFVEPPRTDVFYISTQQLLLIRFLEHCETLLSVVKDNISLSLSFHTMLGKECFV
jgi:membrane protease subunit (stomatin/prohibitin family)